MARKQSRRAVSVRVDVYNRLQDYCDRVGASVSGLTEEQINSYLDQMQAQGVRMQPSRPQ